MRSTPASPAPVALRPSTAAAWWGLGGTAAVLVDAIVRLTPKALAPWQTGDGGPDLALLTAAVVAAMIYLEGWRGFHLRFAPRAVHRAATLHRAPGWAAALAPLTVMGLLYATRRRLIGSWALIAGIVALVFSLRLAPAGLRAAVDAGVVAGLATGLLSLALHQARALRGQLPPVPPDWPDASA
jgi:hypothetical protein